MPYQPIPLNQHVQTDVVYLVRNTVDPLLSEFRFLLTVQQPDQDPKGSLQRSLAVLLLSIADGAAQLLYPGQMEDGVRFQSFLKDNCPWTLDSPEGLTVEEACSFLWEEARCPMLHRFGVRSNIHKQKDSLRIVKFGRIFSSDDASITDIEMLSGKRPYSHPSIKRDESHTILLIESFYWALRMAIEKTLNTEEKSNAVDAWLKSGQWDRKSKQKSSPPIKGNLAT